jgi:flagellar basal body-associated protein FliL
MRTDKKPVDKQNDAIIITIFILVIIAFINIGILYYFFLVRKNNSIRINLHATISKSNINPPSRVYQIQKVILLNYIKFRKFQIKKYPCAKHKRIK